MTPTTCKIIPFPAPKQANDSEEILSVVERYSGNTADHISDTLLDIRDAVGDALFLHIQPTIKEVLWDFAKECGAIGFVKGLKRGEELTITKFTKAKLEKGCLYGEAQEKACKA